MLHEDVGASFVGADSQLELTPLQRQIIEAAKAKEAEAKRKQQEEMRQGATGGGQQPMQNARGGGKTGKAGAGLGDSDTTRYVNKNEYPDHPVHDDE